MTSWRVVVFGAVLTSTASAGQAPVEIPWDRTANESVVIRQDGSLTVTSDREDGVTVTIAEIVAPEIKSERYVVAGRATHQDVDGKGYVEMWSTFAEGSYFSRTNLDSGPMGAMTGSSDWRELALPFDASGSSSRPERLTINVVLPGRGEVTLLPMTLSDLSSHEWPASSGSGVPVVWGVWSGLAGAALGVVGGLLGWLGGKGKARTFVLAGFRALRATGLVAAVVGAVGALRGMPYPVYFPFLLLGGIAFLVSWVNLPRLTKRYQDLELRRMSALDG